MSGLPSECRIGLIGSGAMARAIATGLIHSKIILSSNLYATDANQTILKDFTSSLQLNGCSSNLELLEMVNIIILAVKPHIVTLVMEEIGSMITSDQLLISIAAGVTIQTIANFIGTKEKRISRVMPNTPALIGAGASAISMAPNSQPEDTKMVETIFKAIGKVVLVREVDLDAVTGLSGSGPAFAFLFIEALSDGGVRAGLSREVSNLLASQMVYGSSKLVLESGKHTGQLKDQVASPGGTTIAGIHALEKGRFRGSVMDAVLTAAKRATEMGKQQEDQAKRKEQDKKKEERGIMKSKL